MPSYLVQTFPLGGDPTGTRHRNIARNSNGRILIAHCGNDGALDQIWLSHSDDDGVTWAHQQLTNNPGPGGQRGPSIAVDSQNNVHIAWDGYGWGANPARANVQYLRWDAGTGAWDAQVALTDDGNHQLGVAIVCDSLDNIYVTWVGTGIIAPLGETKIFLRWRSSVGVWSAVEAIASIVVIVHAAATAMDRTDTLHVIWPSRGYGANPGNTNIQYVSGTPGAWSAREPLTDLGGGWASHGLPSIALDSSDIPHVCFDAQGYGATPWRSNILYTNRTGGVWQPLENLTEPPGIDQNNAFISLDLCDIVYIHWENATPNIVFTQGVAGAWSTIALFQPGVHVCSIWANWPNVRNNIRAGGFSIVLNDPDLVNDRIYYGFPTGASWPAAPPPPTISPLVITLPATEIR